MSVKLNHDPFNMLLDAFNCLFHESSCEIRFVKWPVGFFWQNIMRRPVGETRWDKKGNCIVSISINGKLGLVLDTLAHELAHVVSGYDAAHGNIWRGVYKKIVDAYDDAINERIGRTGEQT